MPTVKCDKCGHIIEVEDSTKKYKLPLFFITLGAAILGYENLVSKPSLIIALLGVQLATAGLIWLVVARIRSNRA
jgi:hypothetical protein